MDNIDAEQQAVEDNFDHLADALGVLQTSLQPLTDLQATHHPSGDPTGKLSLYTICNDYVNLPAIEQARLYAALAYTLASLNHIQLSLAGENDTTSTAPPAASTPQQGVKRELERIKRYMMNIEQVAKGDGEPSNAQATTNSETPAKPSAEGVHPGKRNGNRQHHSNGKRSGDKRTSKQPSSDIKRNKHVKL